MDLTKYLGNEEIDEFDELYRRIAANQVTGAHIENRLHRRDFPGPYIEPTFENGFAQVGAAYEQFRYRIWTSGKPQFKGHIDCTGATSGTIACHIPIDEDGAIIPRARYHHTIITDGVDFQMAMLFLDTDGSLTVTWPAV